MRVEIKARNDRRCRAGHCFTGTPEFFDEGDFTDEQWKALEDDPMLSMRAVSEEEEEAARGEGAEDTAAIADAIRTLGPGDFTATGQPKVASVNAALKAADLSLTVDAAGAKAALDAMIAVGTFSVPVGDAPAQAVTSGTDS